MNNYTERRGFLLAKKRKRLLGKLQWKLIAIFVLLVLSVMIVTGTLLLNSISAFYHNRFTESMNQEFSGNISDNLIYALSEDEPIVKLKEVMEAYSTSRLGINNNRDYYILEGKSAKFISGSSKVGENPEITENIISAIAGSIGDKVLASQTFMDYAYPVKSEGKVEYIIYIKDNKQELLSVSHNMFSVIINAILYGALISLFLSILLSRTITVPIKSLTEKASKMSEGKFDNVIDVKGDDEIGDLTNTFNNMAVKLKQTLDEISGEKDKIAVILKNLDDGVMAFNLKGKSTHINPAAGKMLNIDRRKKYSFDEFFEPFGIAHTMKELMKNDPETKREWQIETNGIILNIHFAPYSNDNTGFEGIIATFQDITKQQKLEQSRRTFVANVSHELRTPLTNIKSYSETLLDNDIDDKETMNNFLSVINNEADRMTRLVKDLLVLSQLDHSKAKFNFEETDLQKLTGDIINTVKIDAEKRKQTITFIKSGTTFSVMIDKDRISQVILNILSNAIKYTPDKGTITVVCGHQEQMSYIKISDTGIGIPEKDLPMIFERFYRVDKARSRKEGGTGLGLAIAKELVEAHNGTISIDSEYEKGTTVTIKLPVNVHTDL